MNPFNDEDVSTPVPSTDEEDELVDLKLDTKEDGSMNLEFKSHRRIHNLKLHESRIKLSNIPTNFLGMPAAEIALFKTQIEVCLILYSFKYITFLASSSSDACHF